MKWWIMLVLDPRFVTSILVSKSSSDLRSCHEDTNLPSSTPIGTTIVTIQHNSHTIQNGVFPALRTLYVCNKCDFPDKEGGIRLEAIVAAQQSINMRRLRIDDSHHNRNSIKRSPLIYVVPNEGSRDHGGKLLNEDNLKGSVALFNSGGGISIVQKVLQAQRAHAIGVIIIDDGSCSGNHDISSCFDLNKGFRTSESRVDWSLVKILCLMVTKEEGARLLQQMTLERIQIHGISGTHLVQVQ